jgi:CHAT domain-containing protein/Tfp pilus assembly protein PilF
VPSYIFAQTEIESDSAHVHALLSKGGQAARTANYDSASYYYTQAENLSREVSYKHGIMSSTMGHGLVHHHQREVNEALDYYLQALEMTQEGIDLTHPDLELLYNNLGGVYIDLGYRLKARYYLEKALEQKKSNNNTAPISAAITHYNLGLIYLYFGENQSALHNFMAAYPGYLEYYGENGARVAQLYTNIGNIHKNLGNIEQAQEYFQRGIAIHMHNHGPDYWNLAYPYTNLGALYVKTGKATLGLQYYLKSLELCRKNRKELIRLESLNQGALAKYYLEQENYELSMDHAHQAVDIMQKAFYAEHPRISDFYTIIGQCYVKQRDFEQATQWFEQAIDLTGKGYGETHPQIATLYLEQSKIYHQIQDYPRALQKAQQALIAISGSFTSSDPKINPRVDEVLNEKLLINIIKHKGDVFKGHANQENRLENLASALDQYREAVMVIDHLRRGFLSESAKLFLQNNAHEVYQQGIDASYQLYNLSQSEEHLSQAFYYMEKSRASILSEALQASNVTAIQGVDPGLLQKEMELAEQVKSLELKLADAQIEETDSIQLALKKDLFHAKARVDSLVDVIRTSYPDYHQLKYDVKVLDFNQAKELVPNRGMALSFFEADSSWYLLGIGEHTAFKRIPKSVVGVATIDRFRTNISNQEADMDLILADGQLIYQELLRETLQQNPNTEQLLVIPDGILNYLPFDALISTNGQEEQPPPHARYLLEDYVILYQNSLTLYANFKNQGGRYDQVYVGFAPSYAGETGPLSMRESLAPLKGARAEVERAGNMFKGKRYLDQAATEHEFKHGQASSSILHLAMHALVDDENPMRSRLLFTQESDSLEDGDLNAYEIYQLQLDAELAVLSACNTGMGKINKGEGVMSLSRAFMYAGCPNIVMSLWQAADQPSSQIMYTFFENLKKGLPKHEALREAKLMYLSTADPFKAHPANWAAFVLLGDDQPLSRPNNPWLWIGLGALSLVLSSLYYRKRKLRRKQAGT